MNRPVVEIRIDALVNNADLLRSSQATLEDTPIEQVVVRFNHRHAFDFGAWCYGKRFGNKATKKVQLSKHLPERTEFLKNIASHVITQSLTSNTATTGYSIMADWVIMAKWCEENGHSNFMTAPSEYHEGLKAFVNHLNNDHRQYPTRCRMRTVCANLGEQGFKDSGYVFTAQLPPIKRANDAQAKPNQVPSDAEIKHHLQTCEPIFIGLTDFLISNSKFPFKLNLKNDHAWLIADKRYPFISQKALSQSGELCANSITFDYGEGRLRTWDEYADRTEQTEYVRQRYHYEAEVAYKARLEEANKLNHNQYRIRLARIAHDAFIAIFVAATGINESPMRALPWDAEFKIEADEIGFKAIKFRADNKTFTVKVKASFIKYFKKYIKLRTYLCEKSVHPYLFIGFNGNTMSNPRMLDTNILARLHERLVRFADPELPCLSYRAFRDYKDNYIAKSHGPEASRNILQHSEKTQSRSYLKANEKTALDKINDFHTAVNEFFGTSHSCTTPVGGCDSENNPAILPGESPVIAPDCRSNTGCLHCVNFKVHANREDAWKLISLEYITKQMIHVSADTKHFDAVHGPTLQRIDSLLNRMSTIDSAMTETILTLRKEVYDNDSLTDYWQRQLERLIQLKVIA